MSSPRRLLIASRRRSPINRSMQVRAAFHQVARYLPSVPRALHQLMPDVIHGAIKPARALARGPLMWLLTQLDCSRSIFARCSGVSMP